MAVRHGDAGVDELAGREDGAGFLGGGFEGQMGEGGVRGVGGEGGVVGVCGRVVDLGYCEVADGGDVL